PVQRHMAYGDHPLPIGLEQTISQPYIVALMTQSLALKGDENVLEIGTGSGYQTAVLAELARHVYTVERLPQLSEKAQNILRELQYNNISFRVGDGTGGWPEKAPFEAILVAAASESVPPALVEQLSLGGRMVIPVGDSPVQDLLLLIKNQQGIEEQNLCGCRFVPLIHE
ncbi:MAG: protein-L-isoaspartate(D-aspartate) O-methyltransferase, partial [Firmicutes bacterium]|nr:protein-L-isoaspartate(D-aspartate) O-methyltransferase [Bacillota bacterium]